jgi:hypothetical protein
MDTEARPGGSGPNPVPETNAVGEAGAWKSSRPLWVQEPVGTPRLPDPVRTAAVRAVVIVAVTLIEAMVAALAVVAESWFAAPAILATVVSTVLATWGVLDVWITRQVWNQRHGVVSSPSSAARALRRERRRARRAARAKDRAGPSRHIPGLSSGS